MHVRFPRAAVALDSLAAPAALAPKSPEPACDTTQILWASRPLPVSAGHLVAVRHRAGVVEIALVATGRRDLSWISPSRVLTEHQFNHWKRLARFGK
jgi:hypothetical protein